MLLLLLLLYSQPRENCSPLFLSESSPVSHTERRLREGGKVVHQIVLGTAPVLGEGGEAALTVHPVTAGPHGQLLVTALADQGLHLADALLFASLVLEPDLREERLQKKTFFLVN
jgi:hypothetical protein